MKKPKQSDHYNYKSFFSLLLLALVDAEYRFLWIECGSSGCGQIFNRSLLWEKIENGSLGLPPPEPLGEGGPELHYFLLGDDAFALTPWMVKPYSQRQLTREERIANYRISRGRRVVENAFGILVSRFRILLSTMQQRPRIIRDIVFMCVMLHNMLRTHQGGADRAPTPGNNVAAQQNEKAVYVPNEIYRNPLREAKKTTERLLQSSWGIGWAGGQDVRCVSQTPWGQKLGSIGPFQDNYQSFSGLTKNFYLSWCYLNFQQFFSNKSI